MKKIIFMGTPLIAKKCLESLIKKYEILFVVTQPDKKKDRKGNFVYSEVKTFCLQNDIKFFQPEKISEIKQDILDANADLIVTCAYGQFVPNSILVAPKYKSVNLHGSLLPKLRGGAPIQWSIIHGFKETGITLMYMDSKMDHGNIIYQQKIAIDPLKITYSELYLKMGEICQDIIENHLDMVFSEHVQSKVQNEQEVSFGLNITKADRYINWNVDDGQKIIYLINGLNDCPYALSIINQQEIKIAQAEFIKTLTNNNITNGTITQINKQGIFVKVQNGLIKIIQLQIPNKKMLFVHEFINGNNLFKINDQFQNLQFDKAK